VGVTVRITGVRTDPYNTVRIRLRCCTYHLLYRCHLDGDFRRSTSLFPQVMFTLSDDPGVPANPGWVRWAGRLLLGMAVAKWLAANNPESQRPLAVGLATAFTLIALALLYSNLVGDYRGTQLLSWLQIVGNGAFAAAMWWLSSKSIAKGSTTKTRPSVLR
jgi:hypothetical protein